MAAGVRVCINIYKMVYFSGNAYCTIKNDPTSKMSEVLDLELFSKKIFDRLELSVGLLNMFEMTCQVNLCQCKPGLAFVNNFDSRLIDLKEETRVMTAIILLFRLISF